jgi:hypothetical protein
LILEVKKNNYSVAVDFKVVEYIEGETFKRRENQNSMFYADAVGEHEAQKHSAAHLLTVLIHKYIDCFLKINGHVNNAKSKIILHYVQNKVKTKKSFSLHISLTTA